MVILKTTHQKQRVLDLFRSVTRLSPQKSATFIFLNNYLSKTERKKEKKKKEERKKKERRRKKKKERRRKKKEERRKKKKEKRKKKKEGISYTLYPDTL